MRLVFLGDVSVVQPFCTQSDVLADISKADLILANLEGPIVPKAELGIMDGSDSLALCNSVDVLEVLRAFNIMAVYLANNHLYDVLLPARHTKEMLASAGIASFGAGTDLDQANKAFAFSEGNTSVKLFAFGWDVIGCKPATKEQEGVNPLTPEHTLHTIRCLRSWDDSSFVIFVMHWNFELERYPQPAQRQLAHKLIDEGVDAIIGLHSHVAQGGELVNGKPIIYGLGNWFFPVRQLGHLRLAFPPIATRQLALELTMQGRQLCEVHFHWHQFDSNQTRVSFERTEDWQGMILRELTPFASMSHKEYVRWFKVNRTRRRGLPVYQDYHHIMHNRIKDMYVKLRHSAIQRLVLLRLKGGPRK